MNRDDRRATVIAGLYSPPDWNPDSSVATVARVATEATEAMSAGIRQFGRAMQQVATVASGVGRRMLRAFRDAGLLVAATPPRNNVRARALWMRQHRNTGPSWRPRPPRVIDARV